MAAAVNSGSSGCAQASLGYLAIFAKKEPVEEDRYEKRLRPADHLAAVSSSDAATPAIPGDNALAASELDRCVGMPSPA